MGIDANAPIFVISVAAELAEMHPQTLRQYDRLGIVRPSRAPGRSRRYSQRDIELLREVQKLSQEGVSLEGIKRIMELQNQVTGLRQRIVELSTELDEVQRRNPDHSRVFAAGLAGDVVTLSRGQRPPAAATAVKQLGLVSLMERRSRLRALPAGKTAQRNYADDGYVQSL
ncbi:MULTISPECIES: heat shock protein transcriptional repressor HspR [unclassified Arthrobacter]|uniref:heat shock protein transcriptional repressor HspR n=1 Tax=unclassified Arthrobacter TaxID=235627 RepID=UPI001D1547C0|nr:MULTISPECIES: MerR family transcriptional regulator [unclassified Arthrobacter]MCC3275140.1 MerR family transcriptional regulator [Arthrobacter sp. zg-Y20]MCC3278217.1 MerR family transcriptional regulator [Arthrobacter sp. zg-Y40]MCC9176587.1 MerR family transcriptional regulator [Arthrobacter sp. zg-Y750]MDK1315297.1 MerR family transcriptional regulator [Arthrobacter sp. zg.Y20]MDK1326710.1 MerR family transcriptional regulator [Arthrobacter sp. zg-Y1143]